MATRNTTTSDFEVDVIQSKTPVLVDFWAPWCPPCRAIAPSLEELSDELAGKLQVVKVDIDEHPELARRYGVRSIPALKVFVDGNVAKELLGAMPKQALRAELAAFV
ncbi:MULTISPECIES: thioredoxin [Achromobacter]|uniref:Thioredoxin n=2 Tax=Achromobacter TaxID=222 RepID=A0AA42WBJ1_9BURK|nr:MULTISPECIES: thioredoxin [Achromobacter]MBK1982670.1 thioredoxin [Achromobacter xylosoxidans]MDH2052345.1 thioredoxin [Achromobacter marplatensis]PQZ67654.1 thioredoxin [Achromobacter sp. MYb9]CUJ69389.1 Thioredoxin C-1 [Achromobacter aegrifaciens]